MSNVSFCCDCPQWCGNLQCCGLEVPSFLKIPQDERNASWKNAPPLPPPRVLEMARTVEEDPSTIALREELEASKRAKTSKRIDKLLASKVPPVDHSGERWDARRNRWVPLLALAKPTNPGASQEPGEPIKPKAKPQKPKALSVASKPHKGNKKPKR